MSKYTDIKEQQPVLEDCFWAFSNEQFAAGRKVIGEDKKILRGPYGLYGTHEGMAKLMAFYDNLNKQIAEQCDPQEVYNYEYGNHECGYTNDDREAIAIVLSIFGMDKTITVKRKNKCYSLSEIENETNI